STFLCAYLIIARSPQVTLFPYTTLFRSENLLVCVSHGGRFIVAKPEIRAMEEDLAKVFRNGGAPNPHFPDRDRLPDMVVETAPQDRKSTRLNSSHVKISYAVFCLKNKREYFLGACYASYHLLVDAVITSSSSVCKWYNIHKAEKCTTQVGNVP